MLKLYDLAAQYEELVPLAENADDEAELQAFYDTLDGLQGEISDKVENCAAVVKTLCAQVDAIKVEEKRLGDRRRAIENSAERLKLYMRNGMESAQMDKVKGKLFTITIQSNPPAVVIDDEVKLPADCKKIKVEVNKAVIAERLKAGTAVPGAHLEHGKSLRIR